MLRRSFLVLLTVSAACQRLEEDGQPAVEGGGDSSGPDWPVRSDAGAPEETSSTSEPTSSTGQPIPPALYDCFEFAFSFQDEQSFLAAAGELDGDGRGDLVLADDAGGASVLLAKPDGLQRVELPPLPGPVNGARFVEVAGDGRMHLVLSALVNASNNYVVFDVTDGTPTITAQFGDARQLEFDDVDGDGIVDAFILTADLDMQVHFGDGGGSFEYGARQTVGLWLAALDLTDDGRTDFVVHHFDGQLGLRRGLGEGAFDSSQPFGYTTEDWVIKAVPTTLLSGPALVLQLQQRCDDDCAPNMAFALISQDGAQWSEQDRTPWLGDVRLSFAGDLGGSVSMVFVAEAGPQEEERTFFFDTDGQLHELTEPKPVAGYVTFEAELDGAAPTEILTLSEQGWTALSGTAPALGHSTPLGLADLRPGGSLVEVLDVDADGLDDLVVSYAGSVEVLTNLGCEL